MPTLRSKEQLRQNFENSLPGVLEQAAKQFREEFEANSLPVLLEHYEERLRETLEEQLEEYEDKEEQVEA
jgi:hypothetical protein